ncbi:MAG: SufE family protein [Acidimicrobiia bacterium]|nr:SufE family protein [Acidimicrobiia bacterium]
MSIPTKLKTMIDVMAASPKEFRTEALLDYSKRLPPLPDHIDASELEHVAECQSPFFLTTELDDEGRVHMYFEAPPEAPTTRGFAAIVYEGLDGETPEAILEVPNDFFYDMGLAEIISPLRLRGMAAILARLKRQVTELTDGG